VNEVSDVSSFRHVRSTHNEDGGIVLDIQKGRLLRLNHTGFGNFSTGRGRPDRIADRRGHQPGLSPLAEVARKECQSLLAIPRAQGLI